jgi:hypothetical protein
MIFNHLSLDANVFMDQPADRANNATLSALLKRDGGHHRMAPILFADPQVPSGRGFLMSPVIVKVSNFYL